MTTKTRIYGESIKVKEQKDFRDDSVEYEMSYAEGNRFVMIHVLWSALVFIIALLI